MDHILSGIPEYEFEGEGVVFLPSACDHGAVMAGSPEALRSDRMIDGNRGEDHLLPPHAILEETFNWNFSEDPDEVLSAHAANNPVLSLRSVRGKAKARTYDLLNAVKCQQQIVCDAPDDETHRRSLYDYKAVCLKIAKEEYSIETNIITGESENAKMAKSSRFGWVTEGLSLLPNAMAGVGDLCPYRSKACTANCLNWSGRTEISGPPSRNANIACRARRSLLLFHQPDVFFMRLIVLLTKRAHDAGLNRYAFRPNILADIAWEEMEFFSPWAKGMATLIGSSEIQWYDYTKNPERYQRFLLEGTFPKNYHLTFSLSEINALYAFYALAHGGSTTVVFDADPASYGRYPRDAEPLPEEFCGYRVIDGDVADLRFLDREMFGIPEGEGFVVGLRLKGAKHREKHFALKEQGIEDGFIFDKNGQYEENRLIEESEERRRDVRPIRQERGLKGDQRREYFAGFPPSMTAMLEQWYRGRRS